MSPRPWQWILDFSSALDFVLQVAIDDGLVVHPFNRHESRDGPLQRGGLTPDAWQAWLECVGRAVAAQKAGTYVNPVTCLPIDLASLIATKWSDYILQARGWTVPEELQIDSSTDDFPIIVHRPLTHLSLPTLRIGVVNYPYIVIKMAAPDVALIGEGAGGLTRGVFIELISEAARLQIELNGG